MDVQLGLFGERPLPPGPAAVGPASVDPRVRALAARLPPGLRLGTSSWSFPGWDGIVFDRRASEGALAQHGLAAYAAHPLLRAVGLDRTYYRPIEAADFRAYAAVVPDDFRFVVKADRLLTSPNDPETAGVRRANPLFLDAAHAAERVVRPAMEGLGHKAGVILFQFPPFSASQVGGRRAFYDRLGRFLACLPQGPRYAVEVRTPALLTASYVELLEATRTTHCYNVHPASAPLPRQLDLLQPYEQPVLLIRWMLRSGLRYEAAVERYEPFDRIVDEDAPTRERIATAVLDALIAERDVFVVANNKAEGSAPLSVFGLAERLAHWQDPSARGAPVAP